MAEYDCHRFSGLEYLPTSMLEKMIEQDFNQEEDYDQELIDYVLEILVQRAKKEDPHSIPDVQTSWNKLRQRLDGEVNLGSLPVPISSSGKTTGAPRKKRFLRYVAVVAACIAMILGTMITVQAMGVDVFGALAKWTDSTFRFALFVDGDSGRGNCSNSAVFEHSDLLAKAGIPQGLFPTEIPSGYELEEVDEITIKNGISINGITGIFTSYSNPEGGCFHITVMKHLSPKSINQFLYIKDPGTPTLYISNDIQYYVFTNKDLWNAVGTSSGFTVQVNGIPSEQGLKTILNSIRGVSS